MFGFNSGINEMTFQIKSHEVVLTAAICLYTMIPITADGMSCFKCYASQPGHEHTDLLCSQFDGSARFQVYCPSSTFCMKRTIYHQFQTSVVVATKRDCAPQKSILPIYSKVENKWQNKEEIVKTAYEEGCSIGEDRGAPTGPSEYCFCSFHLCNSSQSIKPMNVYYNFVLIVILLLTKPI